MAKDPSDNDPGKAILSRKKKAMTVLSTVSNPCERIWSIPAPTIAKGSVCSTRQWNPQRSPTQEQAQDDAIGDVVAKQAAQLIFDQEVLWR